MSALRGRRQARPSTAALAVATAVLLCQATAWVHTAATPHVTCVEHGESVHLDVAVRVPAGPADGVTVVSSATEAEAHAHDHCGLQGPRTTSSSTPMRASSLASFAPASASVAAVPKPALLLLRLAPKTSPPRAPAV